MSHLPIPSPAPVPGIEPAAEAAAPGRGLAAAFLLMALGFIAAGAGLYWVWQHPRLPPMAAASAGPDHAGQIAAQAAALAQLADRVSALEHQAPNSTVPATAGLSEVASRLDSLAARQDALAARQAADAAGVGNRVEAVASETRAAIAPLADRVAKQEQLAATFTGLAERARRGAQVQAAEIALQQGAPLGTLADAPPAVARYADAPPPTEAALLAGFPAMAAAVRAAPGGEGHGFFRGAWSRISQSVSIRRGDEVILGDPADGMLARARASLAAGDLAGAVASLGDLRGEAAAAARPWVDRARGLLAARAALAAMAAHS